MHGRVAAFDAVLKGLILLLVMGAPLALGTVDALPLAVFEWLSVLLGLVWILRALWVPPLY
ncbi:MAG TPA: hypothetical protein VNI57_00190, partial [Candidatus Saccharimonadales bacterium]|nr:hypothetical protein [Candidatus Saccharimonadales bacterium]